MRHKAFFAISAVAFMLFMGVSAVAIDAAVAITSNINIEHGINNNLKQSVAPAHISTKRANDHTDKSASSIKSAPAVNLGKVPSQLTLGPHLAPATFHHENPFNITEQEAIKRGIKLIPIDPEHWNALLAASNLNNTTSSPDISELRRREVDPPDPTDWCTPNKDPSQCMFGAWCHEMSNRDVPNRAWVFYNDCELTGDLHPWTWGVWHDIFSGLRWVTVFFINQMRYPTLKYAGREWGSWDDGWELYYPYGTMGMYYYRRYFDCSG